MHNRHPDEKYFLHILPTDDAERFDKEHKFLELHMTELKTAASVSHAVNHGIHNNLQAEEVAPDCLPIVLKDIAFEYTKKTEGYDFPNMPTAPQCACLTLFGRPYLDMQKTEVMTQLGSMVLRGEENDVETVLAEVRKNPTLLDIIITVKDPYGTSVTGTLLQLAAMAGDMNLKLNITDEKDRGLVERLSDAGKLSPDRVARDLACIVSEDAKIENEARIQRYLAIIKKFGNSICEGKITNEEAIAHLEKELLDERSKAVNSGFIFDPRILNDTAQWFEEKVNSFGGWLSSESNVFWVNGFGKLQCMLSARDAQVARVGIGNVVDGNKMPERTLQNPDGSSYFYNAYSRLGREVYLGYYGTDTAAERVFMEETYTPYGMAFTFGKLTSSKNSSMTELERCQANVCGLKGS